MPTYLPLSSSFPAEYKGEFPPNLLAYWKNDVNKVLASERDFGIYFLVHKYHKLIRKPQIDNLNSCECWFDKNKIQSTKCSKLDPHSINSTPSITRARALPETKLRLWPRGMAHNVASAIKFLSTRRKWLHFAYVDTSSANHALSTTSHTNSRPNFRTSIAHEKDANISSTNKARSSNLCQKTYKADTIKSLRIWTP